MARFQNVRRVSNCRVERYLIDVLIYICTNFWVSGCDIRLKSFGNGVVNRNQNDFFIVLKSFGNGVVNRNRNDFFIVFLLYHILKVKRRGTQSP